MKKKIGFVSMDSVLAKWLLEKLIQEPPESDCAADLLRVCMICSAERQRHCF